MLGYNAFQPDAMPNITRNAGTLRFWFKPAWTSGSGPGVTTARLLDMPVTTPASLHLDSSGQHVAFSDPGTSVDAWGALCWTSTALH